jgi:hypothetical protein
MDRQKTVIDLGCLNLGVDYAIENDIVTLS